jgi:hypothetical protein
MLQCNIQFLLAKELVHTCLACVQYWQNIEHVLQATQRPADSFVCKLRRVTPR